MKHVDVSAVNIDPGQTEEISFLARSLTCNEAIADEKDVLEFVRVDLAIYAQPNERIAPIRTEQSGT